MPSTTTSSISSVIQIIYILYNMEKCLCAGAELEMYVIFPISPPESSCFHLLSVCYVKCASNAWTFIFLHVQIRKCCAGKPVNSFYHFSVCIRKCFLPSHFLLSTHNFVFFSRIHQTLEVLLDYSIFYSIYFFFFFSYFPSVLRVLLVKYNRKYSPQCHHKLPTYNTYLFTQFEYHKKTHFFCYLCKL